MLFILFLFFKYLQPIFQEFDIVGDTFVKCIRRAERFAFGIQQNVNGWAFAPNLLRCK